ALELLQEQRTISADPASVTAMQPGSCMSATRMCFLLAHGLPSYMALVFFDDLRQGHLRLGQPEGHIHGTVEVDRGGECRARLRHVSGFYIQYPQAAVAVRLERAHAQRLGHGEGLVVAASSWFDLGERLARRGLAGEPQSPGLRA